MVIAPKGLLCRGLQKSMFVTYVGRWVGCHEIGTSSSIGHRYLYRDHFWNICEGTVSLRCSEIHHFVESSSIGTVFGTFVKVR